MHLRSLDIQRDMMVFEIRNGNEVILFRTYLYVLVDFGASKLKFPNGSIVTVVQCFSPCQIVLQIIVQ